MKPRNIASRQIPVWLFGPSCCLFLCSPHGNWHAQVRILLKELQDPFVDAQRKFSKFNKVRVNALGGLLLFTLSSLSYQQPVRSIVQLAGCNCPIIHSCDSSNSMRWYFCFSDYHHRKCSVSHLHHKCSGAAGVPWQTGHSQGCTERSQQTTIQDHSEVALQPGWDLIGIRSCFGLGCNEQVVGAFHVRMQNANVF